jgi:hypothetical protein
MLGVEGCTLPGPQVSPAGLVAPAAEMSMVRTRVPERVTSRGAALLGPQRHQRIHLRGATGREQAGEGGHGRQQDGDRRERQVGEQPPLRGARDTHRRRGVEWRAVDGLPAGC